MARVNTVKVWRRKLPAHVLGPSPGSPPPMFPTAEPTPAEPGPRRSARVAARATADKDPKTDKACEENMGLGYVCQHQDSLVCGIRSARVGAFRSRAKTHLTHHNYSVHAHQGSGNSGHASRSIVYYCLGKKAKLEGGTESRGVCAKKRSREKAVELMVTPRLSIALPRMNGCLLHGAVPRCRREATAWV